MNRSDSPHFVTETNRLEAFSDGVLAVIITIMVLELHPPHEATLAALTERLPTFLAYVLSFVFIGIYWNNHHHLLRASVGIDGVAMWANLHLLFWLSLVPFTTAWFGEHVQEPLPTALYGIVLLMCAVAYTILQTALRRLNGPDTGFGEALRDDRKGKLSLALTAVGVLTAWVLPPLSAVFYVVVALMWLAPDRRFEPVIALRRE